MINSAQDRGRVDRETLAIIIRMTCATWLMTLAFSWNAYVSGFRIFSPSPAFDALANLPQWVDGWLLGLLCSCLAWLLVRPLQRIPACMAMLCALLQIMQDLLRLQPYIYMYIFTLGAANLAKHSGQAVTALRAMVIGVYFWAGFHKLNATFCFSVFPWFISPFYTFGDEQSLGNVLMVFVMLLTPVFELMIGVLLFFPKQRKLATGMAFVMLAVVLLCLGPTGHNVNSAVWPWNIYLFLMDLLLFYRPFAWPEVHGGARGWPMFLRRNPLTGAAIALFVLAPALAMFDAWPAYPGFKLYSGNTQTADVIFAPDERFAHMPEKFRRFFPHPVPLPVADWGFHEFNTSASPLDRVFRMGARGLCPYLDDSSGAVLRIYSPPPFYSVNRDYRDFPLCPTRR